MATLVGAVVIVTGAGRGIGRAIAEVLGQGGAKVGVNYSQSKGPAEDLVVRLIEETVKQFGRIDVLVNNAGINIDRTMKNLATDDWDKVIQVNLNAYFYTVKAAVPYFQQQKSGKIINISSVTAWRGMFGQTNYAAAKAGIIGFTRSAALELARYYVTANVVAPGYTRTEMYESIPEKSKEAILAQIPLGRVCEPEEVARAVRYLIVDGDYITGTTLNISGGIHP